MAAGQLVILPALARENYEVKGVIGVPPEAAMMYECISEANACYQEKVYRTAIRKIQWLIKLRNDKMSVLETFLQLVLESLRQLAIRNCNNVQQETEMVLLK